MKTTSILDKKAIATEDASPFETLALSIDPNGAEHLMGTLTNLYSNPLESVFREYVSNALDSHMKCGQTKPIKVDVVRDGIRWLLVVQDFGVGMDKDDIVNVYSKYASSTKRDSNEQIGAFGLGAKSALAIANRFDVVTIKNGKRLEFYIEKNSRGVGVIHFVSETTTTAPNGVTVSIPLTEDKAKAINELVAKRDGFFSTWNPDLVLFNGSRIAANGNVYNSEQFVTLTSGNDTLGWLRLPEGRNPSSVYLSQAASVAIAGIRYNVEKANVSNGILSKVATGETHQFFSALADTGFSVIINLPIGSVDLTPSREDIMLTSKTERTLKAAFEELVGEIQRAMASRMNKLDYAEAFAFYIRNAAALGVPNVQVQNSWGGYSSGYNPGFRQPHKVTYKNKPVATIFTTGYDLVALEAANASTWENDGWKTVADIDLAKIFRHLSRNNKSNLVKSSGQYQGVVVYGGTRTEENLATIKRNARSYTMARHDNKYPSVFFIPSLEKPKDKWLNAVVDVVSITELEKVGKAYRSEIAKAAAEGRGPVKKRPAAIHYGIQRQADGTAAYRKYSAEEITEAKEVVVVDFDPKVNHYSNYYSGTRMEVAAFWDSFAETMDNKDAKLSVVMERIYNSLAGAFPEALIIVLPKTRSINPILKANPKAVTIKQALAGRILATQKKATEWKKLKAVAEAWIDSTGNWSLPTRITVEGKLDEVKNKFTREIFAEIAHRGEMLNLIVVGRIFTVLTGTAYDHESNKVIRELFAKDSKYDANGWGRKFSYINDSITSGSDQKDAAIFVNLVNAIDAVI